MYSIISINSSCTIYNEWRIKVFCTNESMGVRIFNRYDTNKGHIIYTERDARIDSLLANQFVSEIEDGTSWKYVSNT